VPELGTMRMQPRTTDAPLQWSRWGLGCPYSTTYCMTTIFCTNCCIVRKAQAVRRNRLLTISRQETPPAQVYDGLRDRVELDGVLNNAYTRRNEFTRMKCGRCAVNKQH
jgi:hypothetical protein